MLVGVEPQTYMASQDLILLLAELRVDLLGGAPHGRAMFLTIPCPAALRVVEAQAHDVGSRADENGQQTLVRPLDQEWMLQCGGQVGEQIRQTAAKGLGDEQRRPDDRDVEEKAKDEVVLLGCLFQAVHLQNSKEPSLCIGREGTFSVDYTDIGFTFATARVVLMKHRRKSPAGFAFPS